VKTSNLADFIVVGYCTPVRSRDSAVGIATGYGLDEHILKKTQKRWKTLYVRYIFSMPYDFQQTLN
jgi:hypothetical protein